MSSIGISAPLIQTERVRYRYRGGAAGKGGPGFRRRGGTRTQSGIGDGGSSALAIRDVSLRVQSGELVGLVGPNGSGKSTLLKLMAGLLAPSAGMVRLDGSPLARWTRRQRARLIAYVPQEAALDFELSVSDVVSMGRFPHLSPFSMERAIDRDAVAAALETTGLVRLAGRSVTRLSGGERQRVLIARALAQQSPLLLLDEPTAHLDIQHQAHLFSLLETLRQEQQVTIVIVLHDLNLAAQYCDRLALLGRGELLVTGSPREVIAPPALRRAYGAALSVTVTPHPLTGRPVVLPSRFAIS